jgi:hypothetical protein
VEVRRGMVGPEHLYGDTIEHADRGHVHTVRPGLLVPVTELSPLESYEWA